MSKDADNEFEGYLFTLKAEEWKGFRQFFENWSKNHSTTEKWSSGQAKSIPKGAAIFVMKQGKSPTGIIAAGFTSSENHPMGRWSKRKQALVLGRANDLRFTHFLIPGKDKLLDINDLPKKYWASRSSGVGLPPAIFREIKRRWGKLLGENASERARIKQAPTLDKADADDEYKIGKRDTRTTALKQIRERRGQATFRQKLFDIYSGRCAISGCSVADVLEAAHIKSYLGQNDNNPQNGLLLRADLHTLFDLLLLGINPSTREVYLHPSLNGSEYSKLAGQMLRKATVKPSFDALRVRWREFQAKIRSGR